MLKKKRGGARRFITEALPAFIWLLVMTAAAVQNVKHELWPRTCSLFCGCSAQSGHISCQKTTIRETRKWVKIQLGVQTLNISLPAAPRSEQQATRKVWSQTGSQQKEESNPVLNICVSLLQVCWPVDADSLPDFFFFLGDGGVSFLSRSSSSLSPRHRFYPSHAKV